MRTSEYTDACCRGLFARIVCRAGLLFFILSISGLASFAQIITTYAGGPPLPVSGQPAVTQAIAVPGSVAPDGAGGFFVSSRYQNRVYHVGADGTLTLTAGSGKPGSSGDGGLAISAQLYAPTGVAVDGAGDLFIADTGNSRIRKVTPAGTITTVAGNGIGPVGFSGEGGPATSAQFGYPGPTDVAVDGAGNLFIADSGNYRVRKVTPAGTITTVAGNVYPTGVVVDGAGNLFIADSGNQRIWKVTPAATITTVAGIGIRGLSGDGGPAASAQLYDPADVAVDGAGNLFIADSGNQRIRKVSPAGTITTVAGIGIVLFDFSGDGGPPTSAQLRGPARVAVDGAGNLFIADTGNQRIRKVTPAGTITTVAGDGTGGFSGDGGPATSAQFGYSGPTDVAVDSAGNLFIADSGNNRIREVIASSQTSSLPRVGSFGQVVTGAGWSTSMTLRNLSAATVNAQVDFYNNDGSPLTLPLSFPNSSTASTFSSSTSLSIPANESVEIQTLSSSVTLSVGWADVSASGPLEGYVVFGEGQTTGPSSEDTVPLDTRLLSSLVLPYDETNGSKTGIALANQSATAATITVLVLDQGGSRLASSQMILPALGHTSFFITDQFSQAANRIGVIEFQNPSGNVTGMGLRFYPGGAFTSMPGERSNQQ